MVWRGLTDPPRVYEREPRTLGRTQLTPTNAEFKFGHASTGSLTLDVYTHSEWEENVEAAKLLGEAIEKAVNSVSLTAIQEKGPLGGVQEALAA